MFRVEMTSDDGKQLGMFGGVTAYETRKNQDGSIMLTINLDEKSATGFGSSVIQRKIDGEVVVYDANGVIIDHFDADGLIAHEDVIDLDDLADKCDAIILSAAEAQEIAELLSDAWNRANERNPVGDRFLYHSQSQFKRAIELLGGELNSSGEAVKNGEKTPFDWGALKKHRKWSAY